MCVRVLCVRLQNVRGTVGQPVPGTQLRVVSPDSLEDVAPGEYGLVLARGPGVCACVRACVRVCVCVLACACACARVVSSSTLEGVASREHGPVLAWRCVRACVCRP